MDETARGSWDERAKCCWRRSRDWSEMEKCQLYEARENRQRLDIMLPSDMHKAMQNKGNVHRTRKLATVVGNYVYRSSSA